MSVTNLSEMPMPLNVFAVEPAFQNPHPLATALDALGGPETASYSRVDLQLPQGCRFSLFLVRGYPRGEECPAMMASLVVCRELAHAIQSRLDDGEIIEFPIEPRQP